MVDVGAKTPTRREAGAEAMISLPAAVARELTRSGHRTKKGPVFDTAIIAGVLAAKRTHELIPFCHPLPLSGVKIVVSAVRGGLRITCNVTVTHTTGVEMEALTGASVAALAVYDMCKAMSHDIRIGPVRLMSKSGGKRDFRRTTQAPRR
jgi:cyclic pyranopterin phosphate synthase